MKDFTKLLGFASFAAVLIAGADLYAYWFSFGVNPFPSLTFQQLVALSSFPLFQVVGWFTPLVIMNQLLVFSPSATKEIRENPGAFRRLGNIQLTLFVLVMLTMAALSYWDGIAAWWIFLASLLPFAYIELSRTGLVVQLPFKRRSEVLGFYIVCLLFLQSFFAGSVEAHDLKRQTSPFNAIVTTSGKDARVKLIGRLGDFLYLYGGDKTINLVPVSQISGIKFMPGNRIRI